MNTPQDGQSVHDRIAQAIHQYDEAETPRTPSTADHQPELETLQQQQLRAIADECAAMVRGADIRTKEVMRTFETFRIATTQFHQWALRNRLPLPQVWRRSLATLGRRVLTDDTKWRVHFCLESNRVKSPPYTSQQLGEMSISRRLGLDVSHPEYQITADAVDVHADGTVTVRILTAMGGMAAANLDRLDPEPLLPRHAYQLVHRHGGNLDFLIQGIAGVVHRSGIPWG